MIHTFHFFFLLYKKAFIDEVEYTKPIIYTFVRFENLFSTKKKKKEMKKIQVNVMEIVKSGISNDSALLEQIIDPVGRRQIKIFF